MFPHRLEMGDVEQSAVSYGLRLLAAQLRSQIETQRAHGYESPTREAMLGIIEGDAESPGLLPKLGEPRQKFLDHTWVKKAGDYRCSECEQTFPNEVDAMAHHTASGHRYSLIP